MNIDMTNEIGGDFLMTVKEANAESYIIEFKFTRFNYTMKSAVLGEMINVDTERDAGKEDPTSLIFNALLNVPMEFEMLKSGRIIDMTGGDNLVNSMIEAAGLTDPAEVAAMRESMSGEFGGQKFAAGFEQFTYIYPDNPSATKETWKNSIDGDLIADNVWTLAEVNSNGLKITGESDIQIRINNEGTEINAEGTQTTSLSTNRKTGFMVTFHSESTAVGESKVQALPGENIPTTIETITDYSVD